MATPKGLSKEDSVRLVEKARQKLGQLKVVAMEAGVCDSHIYHILSKNPRHRLSHEAAERIKQILKLK